MNDNQVDSVKADILIVDDTLENLRVLSALLAKEGYNVRKSLNGSMALTAVQAAPPDLILLDIMMPEIDGYAVCRQLKQDPQTAKIPVIFLSAINEGLNKAKAFSAGGADYITKPFQVEEVLARIRNQLALRAAEQRNEQLNAELENRVKERTYQLEAAQAKLLKIALYDALTGLPNRTLFINCLEQALNLAKNDSSYQFAVLCLDCDRFNLVNDSLGHQVGDELLIAIADRLGTVLNQDDTLARMGGDEFAMLLSGMQDNSAHQVAKHLLELLAQPFQLEQHEIFVNASVGVALGSPAYEQPEHVLRDAGTALYRAKASGRFKYQVFNPGMHQAALQLLQLETDLRKAIQQEEFIVHYQPVVSLRTGKITGLEALVRWQHPQRGLVSPGLFIPIAEETGLISQIDSWVLRTACQQLQHWQQEKLLDTPLTLGVNLSAQHLTQPGLIESIDRILEETQLNPRFLKLEITESAVMSNAQATVGILQKIRERDIQLSIDDFGTGYSSLSYLHSFPVNSLKIDRSFVQRIDETWDSLGLILLIINIAHTMGMNVIAEGIEMEQQLLQLKGLNCDFGQGFLFSEPLAADKLIHLISSNPTW
ncbi:EAL domain-containing protein [Kovacikia minuta CCNUW1]|uniref:putative bifunctional diguanylate cyclase/phosphodiesterase n=1 Tax=Kovacikia minuta TaxID=2931930 RepID=UPI001CCCFC65|nr:GGDEF domain-containing response regulator [Kovacikia minuta]UBF24757.1 EAL domain-containing protein [Kovacikia minuta CCNUW1]